MKTRLFTLILLITLIVPIFAAPRSGMAATGDPVLINEVLASHTGTDTTEYLELYGTPGYSLAGLSLIVVESDNIASLGNIDRRIDFSSADALGTNGFYLVGNPSGLATNYGVSPNVSIANDFFENSSLTIALVQTSSITGSSVSGSEVVLDSAGITDGGAGDTFFFGAPVIGPDGTFFPAGARRVADGVDTDAVADWVFADFNLGPSNTPTAGGAPPPPPEACGDPFTPIYDVQGSSLASPLVGMEVAIEGVVVGDFQNNASPDNGNLNGFHVQDPTGDSDAATSDGIFVFAPGGMDVSLGDAVRVRGAVSEFNGLTEITASQIWLCSSGNSVTATSLSLPVTSITDFEAYEGMYVTFPQALVISEYFNFDRFNEIVLTSERHLTPTAEFEPGPAAIQAAQDFLLDKITLDDGRTNQNPDPAIHPNGFDFDLTNLFRGGDTVSNVTGVMDYAFGLYRIQPTQGADYTNANPRTAQPEDVGGNLKVASFNVLNYFTTLDYPTGDPLDNQCGPLQNQECRGADANQPLEFTRQRDKIIAALSAIDADVVGLIEIENHPFDVPTTNLVSGLNAVLGAGTYNYIATGAIGSDAIRVALIYKPAMVSPMGAYAILDNSVDSRFLDDFNRPVLAQTFMDNATGGIFTVAVNHLKSKGSSCNAVGDPDTGDGSGNCNLTRKAAAEALVDWLASDPTGSGDADFLIIGDLNSYDKEDPIDVLLAGGYTDLVKQYQGEDAYSYVFDGQLGYLDHALASPGLLDEVTGTTVWHINADEPDLIDYDTSFKGPNQDAIYAPDAYRSSDHDPVIVGLSVCDEIDPTFDELSVSPDSLWPANHKYVDVTATVVVSDNFDPNPVVTLVSVESNEPDDGLGDGDTPDDIVIVDDYHFMLRAERAGNGAGRIYTITYTVTDACGNATTMSVTVSVPHSR